MAAARVVTMLIVVFATIPARTIAQRVGETLQSFEPEVRLRIRTVNKGIHIGRLERVAGDTLFMSPLSGSGKVEINAIDQIWVRGTATEKGALIGGVTGAVLGALTFALFSYGICDAADCRVDGQAVILGGVIVGATGAATGAVIGAMLGQWHLKFP